MGPWDHFFPHELVAAFLAAMNEMRFKKSKVRVYMKTRNQLASDDQTWRWESPFGHLEAFEEETQLNGEFSVAMPCLATRAGCRNHVPNYPLANYHNYGTYWKITIF